MAKDYSKIDYSGVEVIDGGAAALAAVLKGWRTAYGFSLFQMAQAENCRIEVLQHVEQGKANMSSLMLYVDFIRLRDRAFLDHLMGCWCQAMGYEL